MITENLSTLKIHKLTQEQYDRELAAGRIDPNALYLTPDESNTDNIFTEESAFILSVETGLIEPVANEDGKVLTDENNKIIII